MMMSKGMMGIISHPGNIQVESQELGFIVVSDNSLT
jgi:hypothetical protein